MVLVNVKLISRDTLTSLQIYYTEIFSQNISPNLNRPIS